MEVGSLFIQAHFEGLGILSRASFSLLGATICNLEHLPCDASSCRRQVSQSGIAELLVHHNLPLLRPFFVMANQFLLSNTYFRTLMYVLGSLT